jgi:protein phosphatase
MSDKPRLATESIAGLRPYQEDSVLTQTLPDGRTLVAVADGMGGHAAGEVASALALEKLVEAVTDGTPLGEAFALANRAVHSKSREPGKAGMGTTLVAMLLDGDGYEVANVGDSRAYLITGEGIQQITEDHSFVAEAMKRGQPEEEALSSKWKDALTKSIGTEAEVTADVFGPLSVEPNTAVMLCSDGCYKTLRSEDLLEVFMKSGGPRGAAQSLVSEAYDRGSDDNITVAIAEFGEVPRDRPAGTMPIEFDVPDADSEADPEPDPEVGAEPADSAGEGKSWWKKIFD